MFTSGDLGKFQSGWVSVGNCFSWVPCFNCSRKWVYFYSNPEQQNMKLSPALGQEFRVNSQGSGSSRVHLCMPVSDLAHYVIGWSVTRTQSYHWPKECSFFIRLKVHPSPDVSISEVFEYYGLQRWSLTAERLEAEQFLLTSTLSLSDHYVECISLILSSSAKWSRVRFSQGFPSTYLWLLSRSMMDFKCYRLNCISGCFSFSHTWS